MQHQQWLEEQKAEVQLKALGHEVSKAVAMQGEVAGAYQEPTPLLSGHVDVPEARDAKSYAAEAARCMQEVCPAAACHSFV